ncbi:unnamed protein product [Adineta steineri]|uniref:Secreted protein n=1 Tax=Adineta steineri TaxID=433720 RepID=A0A814VTY9_9BILA|nr:unnamed protein product [Adineta steineri]CAF1453219.1 unnamed protein product [Adineta steineri]
MKSILICITILCILIKINKTAELYSSSQIRCMDGNHLNCNNSLLSPTDFQCVSAVIPRTNTQEQFNTTMCIPSSSKQHNSKINISQAKLPPIMASSWSAATTIYYNM